MKMCLVIIFASMGLASCTTRLVSREDNGTPNQAGIPYRLPFLRYSITAKYTLVDCTPDSNGRVKFKIDVDATPTVTEDGAERLIVYPKLSNNFKTSDFSVDYYEDTKLLKTINASVTDKGPEVAVAILKTAVSAAAIAYGIPVVPVPSKGDEGGGAPEGPSLQRLDPRYQQCNIEVKKLVVESNAARDAIKSFPAETQKIADRLAVFTIKAQLGAMTDADKKQAAKDLEKSQQLAKSLAILQKQLAKNDERLTYEAKWVFPEDSTKPFEVLTAPASINTWIALLLVPPAGDNVSPQAQTTLSALLSRPGDKTACTVTSATRDNTGGVPPAERDKKAPSTTGDADGIAYRSPAPGTFMVCLQTDCDACRTAPNPLFSEDASVPQFGKVRLIQLRNGWGQDNALSATFAKTGELTNFKYTSKSASAEKAAGVAASAAAQAASIVDERRAKKDADAVASQKAEIDTIQHQIDVYTLQGQLATIRASQADPNTAAQNAQISNLTAQVALLKLEQQKKDLLEAMGNSP